VVVPPAARGGDLVAPGAVVAGLPLLRRIALAGGRAGFGWVWVPGAAPRDGRAVADGTGPGRVVVLASNVVPTPRWLRALRELPLEKDTLYVDGSVVAVIESGTPSSIVSAAVRCRSVDELVAAFRGTVAVLDRSLEPNGRFLLGTRADVPHAETWLLQSLIKQGEGVASRYLERRISLAITRRLVTTGMTPNAMTLVSVSVGLVGAPFFLSSAPVYQLPGALLFLAHSILDGCDGELARLKFLESRRGAVLDFWGDNLVHAVVFACMAIGWSLAVHAVWPLLLGTVLVASSLGAAATLFRRIVDDQVPGPDASSTARVAERFAHRDFIYLVVALAAVGKAAWFVAAAAVGTPIFLLLILGSDRPARPR
jgi:phosphatidylglycerophosphate synthase